MKGIEGKNVLVTGGSSGIGQAIAVRMAEEGANVAINYVGGRGGAEMTEEQIEQAVHMCMSQIEEHGTHTTLVAADVSNEEQVKAMFAQVITDLGGVDILINNAGIQVPAPSHELALADLVKVLNVNLVGAFLCAREAIAHFLAEGKPGSIVNVSSVHEIIPKPRFVGYSLSKGGMENLTKTLALEYAGRGIRVNAIGPGATITPINRAWVDDPMKREMVEAHIPMGRAGDAWEMGAAAAFLCSDDAAYITGQTLFVDGGLTLYPDFRTSWSSE